MDVEEESDNCSDMDITDCEHEWDRILQIIPSHKLYLDQIQYYFAGKRIWNAISDIIYVIAWKATYEEYLYDTFVFSYSIYA